MDHSDQYTEVEFGPRKALALKGGFYDRFRSNPDLTEVAKDPLAGNLDFFLRFPKQQVPSRVGPTWAPNFYYRASTVQLLYLAPLARIRRMLPEPLQPLSPLPGYGLVALTFFHYALCDNDPYAEVSVAVVIRRPGARGSQLMEWREAMRSDSFHAHVLALPVDTEIARVRGVYGYQLPKWLARIGVNIDKNVEASIAGLDGIPDLKLTAPLPQLETRHTDAGYLYQAGQVGSPAHIQHVAVFIDNDVVVEPNDTRNRLALADDDANARGKDIGDRLDLYVRILADVRFRLVKVAKEHMRAEFEA